MTLTTLGSVRVLPRLAAAGWLGRALARLVPGGRRGPGPLDPAALSPHWLRDIGLSEDAARVRQEGLLDWARLERRP